MDHDSRFLSSIAEADHHDEEEENTINHNHTEHNNDTQNLGTTSLLLNRDQVHTNSSFLDAPNRILNQKFHVAALTGNLNLLQELFAKSHVPIDCRDRENSTALLLSCARGHYSCADYLLANGADPNARRITGASPLYFATLYHHTRIVDLLLNKYKAIVDLSTFDGSTPLHIACEHGFTDIVRLLFNAEANANSKMNDGTTPIMLACQNGYLPIVELFISSDHTNFSIQRLDGVTPLFLIVQNGHEKIFDCVTGNINYVEDKIDLAREDGATPLFKACQKGHHSLVTKLLKYKPKLGLLRNGESCLHAATMFNHAAIVRTLLEHGADPLLNNWEGMTPVDLAKEAQINDILDILMKALASKLSEHGRKYLLHKSTRRSNADFDIELIEHQEADDWKLYKSLKSAAELERLEEEIEQIPIIPDVANVKGKQTNAARQTSATKPHRYNTTPLL